MINLSQDTASQLLRYLPYKARINLSKTSKEIHLFTLNVIMRSREGAEALKIMDSLTEKDWQIFKYSNFYSLIITLGALDNKDRKMDPITRTLIIIQKNLLFNKEPITKLKFVDLYSKSPIHPISKKELLSLADSCENEKLLYAIVKSLSDYSIEEAYNKAKKLKLSSLAVQAFTFIVKKGAALHKPYALKSLKRAIKLMNDFNKHDLGCLVVKTLKYLPNEKGFNKVKNLIIKDLSQMNTSVFHVSIQCEYFNYLLETKQKTLSTLNTIDELCALIPSNINQNLANIEAALKAANTLKEIYPDYAKKYLTLITTEINKITDTFSCLKYSAQAYPLMLELNHADSHNSLNSIFNLIPKNNKDIKYLDVLFPLLEPVIHGNNIIKVDWNA